MNLLSHLPSDSIHADGQHIYTDDTLKEKRLCRVQLIMAEQFQNI